MLVKKKSESGQVLLIVVLVMIIALTVGLSLASRSIVDVRTSTEDADSQKALAAAEAGIEQALSQLITITETTFSEIGSSYEADVIPVQGDDRILLNNGNLVEKGESVDIWLVDHDVDGNPLYESADWEGTNGLEIYWGTSSDPCENAALEIAVIVGPQGSPSLKRHAVDPCEDRQEENNFDDEPLNTGPYSIGGETLQHRFSLHPVAPGPNNVLLVSVVPIYTNAIMGVEPSASIPTQGYSINSTGKFGTGDSQVKRSISVFSQYGQLPIEYLNYGLFSP
jgi:type II secretory pathway pseudopilin PulG